MLVVIAFLGLIILVPFSLVWCCMVFGLALRSYRKPARVNHPKQNKDYCSLR